MTTTGELDTAMPVTPFLPNCQRVTRRGPDCSGRNPARRLKFGVILLPKKRYGAESDSLASTSFVSQSCKDIAQRQSEHEGRARTIPAAAASLIKAVA